MVSTKSFIKGFTTASFYTLIAIILVCAAFNAAFLSWQHIWSRGHNWSYVNTDSQTGCRYFIVKDDGAPVIYPQMDKDGNQVGCK